MGTVNLPTELLRTFITVIEVASFTRAADILGRTQPAISLQVKRLEQMVGYDLIERVRRQGFWHQWQLKLREILAHLVGFIMRRAVCDASVALRVSFV